MISIVIPVFNSENTIEILVENIVKVLAEKFKFDIILVKNPLSGPCEAIKEGLYFGNSDCVIVYPADDFLNYNIINEMYLSFRKNNDIVVASRFMKGGSMKGCPIVKSILVRFASTTLYFFF